MVPHIVLISAVYPPEPVVSARMSWDLAHRLAELGNKVTVVCPQPSRPASVAYRQYAGHAEPVVSQENGVEVVRLPSFCAPLSRLAPRLYESWSFGRHASRYLARQLRERPDVIYVNAWPLFAQAQVAIRARAMKVPMVLQIMDIYPESLLNRLPALPRLLLGTPLRMLDRLLACSAARLCVISESMRALYLNDRRLPAEMVVTIPTWQDEEIFESVALRSEVCKRYGVPNGCFTFLYLGNIGPVAGVELTIRAFHEAGISGAQLVIVGDGSEKVACVQLADTLAAKNVFFVADPEVGNVPLLQSMADVFLLPLKRGAGRSSIPSKLPAYLFSAKPVLATVDAECDTAAVIRDGNCGWVGPPEDQEWLAAMMKEVAALDEAELNALGSNGKAYALARLSKAEGVKRLADLVTSVLKPGQGGREVAA